MIVMFKAFLHIIRWPNLLMVAVIQLILFRYLLAMDQSILNYGDFAGLCLLTVLIAASGYVINDYYDADIDRINRPVHWVAGKIIPLRTVLYFYFILIGLGTIFAIMLAWKISLLQYLFIYPVAIAGLWFYSFALKCKPVLGNLWVAIFCAGVIVVVALPDLFSANGSVVHQEIWYYALFAFLATWYREMVKDLEDEKGDRTAGCQTFVVRYGLFAGKVVAVILGVMLFAAMYGWDLQHTDNTIRLVFTVLQGAVVASLAFLWWAKDNTYFHRSSLVIKAVMLGGTLVLLIL